MIWASRWSVTMRTFYRQILSVLYSSFPFGNFRPRLVRALLVYMIHTENHNSLGLTGSKKDVVYVYVSTSFLQKISCCSVKDAAATMLMKPVARQAFFYMFSSKFMLKKGEESGGVKLSPNCFQHLATSVSFVHGASE